MAEAYVCVSRADPLAPVVTALRTSGLTVRADPATAAALAASGVGALSSGNPLDPGCPPPAMVVATALAADPLDHPPLHIAALSALVRLAATGDPRALVIVDPADLPDCAAFLATPDADTRARLAAKALAWMARRDAAMSATLSAQAGERYPPVLPLIGVRQSVLRYGENPHQAAALYALPHGGPSVLAAEQLQGKALSYNNIADADAAFGLARALSEPAAVVVKHATPCGAAVAQTPAQALTRAIEADPVSAFGGTIGLNRPLDGDTADIVAAHFVENVIAPGVLPEAATILSAKKNLRLLTTTSAAPSTAAMTFRSVDGGFLAQDANHAPDDGANWHVVTERAPSAREWGDMVFAALVMRHVRSNAVILVRDRATLGIGTGQTSRVDSARSAAQKAADHAPDGTHATGAVVASDGFFPFPDGLAVAADAGATAAIHEGGSIRDEAVITLANERGMAMVFTGRREFKH